MTEVRNSRLHRILCSERVRLYGCVLFGLAVFVCAYRIWNRYHIPVKGSEFIQFAHCDFHNLLYFPGRATLEGINPYSARYADAYLVNRALPPYSPALLFVAAPFGLLPIHLADILWMLINIGLTILFSHQSLRFAKLPHGSGATLFAAGLLLLSRPGHMNLVLGQVTCILLCSSLGALQLSKTHSVIAGILLAIAMIKPTYGIPLIIVLFFIGAWKTVLIGGAVAILSAAIPWLWIVSCDKDWRTSFDGSHQAHVNDQFVSPALTWIRIDTGSLLVRIFELPISGLFEGILMLLHLIPVLLICLFYRARCSTDAVILWSLLAIPICIYHIVYDSMLVYPILLASLAGGLPGLISASPRSVFCVTLPLALTYANYLTTWTVLTNLGIPHGVLWRVCASLNTICHLVALFSVAWELIRPVRISSID